MDNNIKQQIDVLIIKAIDLYQNRHHRQASNVVVGICSLIIQDVKDNFIDHLYNLGTLLCDKGYYRLAKPVLYKIEKFLSTTMFVQNNEENADRLIDIGTLYQVNDDYYHAKKCYAKAMKIYNLSIGENNIKYAEGLSKLANVYRLMGTRGLVQ